MTHLFFCIVNDITGEIEFEFINVMLDVKDISYGLIYSQNWF